MIYEELIQMGNSILTKKTRKIISFRSSKTSNMIKDLEESLYHHGLVGLAAPQIGSDLRVFVTDLNKAVYRKPENDKFRVFINPELIWKSKKEIIIYEGCGSVAYAKIFAPVKRSEKIVIEAFDENGERFRLKADGMLARVIQHEYDHLNGICFLERVADLSKVMSSEEYRKMMCKKLGIKYKPKK